MKTEIENAITLLAGQITKETSAPNALNFTQAALNLAHVLAVLSQTEANQQISQ